MSDPTEKCLRNILSLLGHPQGAGSCRPTFLAERRSRRQEIFSPVHLVLIVEHTPQTDKELPAVAGPRLFVSVHPSLFDLSVILPSHLLACTHTHTNPNPPDRKYRPGSQRGFLIQTSPVEQPEVAAPTHLPLLSFPLSLSLPRLAISFFFFCLSVSAICPRMSWQHVRTWTHLGCTQRPTHHLQGISGSSPEFCVMFCRPRKCVCERTRVCVLE